LGADLRRSERDPRPAAGSALSRPDPREPAGRLWSWWRGDELPELPPLPDFAAEAVRDAGDLGDVPGISVTEWRRRQTEGNCLYLARLDGSPVGFGSSAARRASFGAGAPSRAFEVPAGCRYLWGFATLPAWRGRGVYPRLLQHVLAAEPDAQRFWILHQQANEASARGIAKAGFQLVGTICFLPGGGLGLDAAHDDPDRARFGAELLGIELL
jgi:GNAT superfamily N-acetyltransferase